MSQKADEIAARLEQEYKQGLETNIFSPLQLDAAMLTNDDNELFKQINDKLKEDMDILGPFGQLYLFDGGRTIPLPRIVVNHGIPMWNDSDEKPHWDTYIDDTWTPALSRPNQKLPYPENTVSIPDDIPHDQLGEFRY